ncbi:class 1 fructose-bisphosphatase [Helicobacter didelphidarum]|uniref:class 1 fructose-bisphosphatase n=1 Tax=Helicobacter didelphidarum TaxID=2040648 RepID=UPI0015F18A22|nr:class 1 fructose-bisphosphatase [Helicobacter didelphidarum]
MNKIIQELQKAAVQVANLLQKREVEYTHGSNSSGDNQLKVDILADKLFGNILSEIGIKGFASEERESAVIFYDNDNMYDTNQEIPMQSLLVGFDPLDGSSLIDSNLTIGSIFGIYHSEFIGNKLLCGIYFLYGPRLEMVVARDKKSLHYLYNYATHTWDFIQEFALQEKGKINAPGGTQKEWFNGHKKIIEGFFQEGYRLRYSGGMVADLHQILCKGGGIFSYPATKDSRKGKLRKLFEVFPFALIFENAGGEAIDGQNRLLLLDTKSIHETTPCFFGSKREINKIIEGYKKISL